MAKEKVKFKDGKFMSFIKDKAPDLFGNLLNVAGDITGIKALGNIGDLIDGNKELSPEDKLYAHQAYLADVSAETERLKIEAEDRESARQMAIEKAKAGIKDPTDAFLIYSAVGLFVVVGLIGLLVDLNDFQQKVLFHILGIAEGVILTIYTFKFGSSKGSKEKGKKLENLVNEEAK